MSGSIGDASTGVSPYPADLESSMSTGAGSVALDPTSENRATASTSPSGPRPDSAPTPAPVPASAPVTLMSRSCVVCRSRKVRCSRESPCSNCRRANIPCVFPPTDRPPRWVRRLDRSSGLGATIAAAVGNAHAGRDASTVAAPPAQVMDRVRNLENLVKELRAQLDQANAAAAAASASSGGGSSTAVTSPGSSSHTDTSSAAATSNVQEQFGRLVVSDDKHSLYVSSGFWSRVNDELDGLKLDTQGLAADESDTSEDEASPGKSASTHEHDRAPAERHAFFFRHNLNPSVSDSRDFQPLPYQVSFLVDTFAEHVNALAQIVHMPTIRKIARSLRSSSHSDLTPANEALMFSIYYAAVTSMEEDDILTNFGSTKAELSLKYRLGLEYALAKADFLHVSDIILVQALCNFLLVGRRHDSPSFIWMMTGLAIRMGQALGLQRDGSHFEHLTPYEIEIRRRVWWLLCVLDVRSSEDQRAELTIAPGSFDTKFPLNLNDSDIDPDSKRAPVEREGLTDMTFARISIELCEITRRVVALGSKDEAPNLEEQTKLLNEMHESVYRSYLQHSTEPGNIVYWAWIAVVRITVGKMKLLTHLPVLFSSPSEHFSEDLRNKLLISAIEVAEHNHAMSAEPRCRQWRWVLQTYTHWHAIVYLLIEMTRRPWSPMIERAWISLQSPWLIPTDQFNVDRHLRVWVPLRKLMAKARAHREAEVERLRTDKWAARQLEADDDRFSVPLTAGPLSAEDAIVMFRDRWRKLIDLQEQNDQRQYPIEDHNVPVSQPWISNSTLSAEQHPYLQDAVAQANTMDTTYYNTSVPIGSAMSKSNTTPPVVPQFTFNEPLTADQGANMGFPGSFATQVPTGPVDGSGVLGWLWADADPASGIFSNVDMNAMDVNMDLEGEIDWSRWVESAQGMEMDAVHGRTK